jgi:formylglycine-generating enzyme required for sulfatase activity
MRGKFVGWSALMLVLALLVAAPSGLSQEPGEKYALLAGVRKYARTSELRELNYPERDMEDLAAVLRDGGYRPENLVLMTQTAGAENTRFLPIAANIRKELKALLRDRIKADSVLVAFAGHGTQFRGSEEVYFCPADTRPDDKATLISLDKATLISLDEVYRELAGCDAQLKLLLSDACRKDPIAAVSRSPTGNVQSVTRPQVLKPPGGVAALFSCSEGEVAFENDTLKHGVFFHFVIQGLRGEADFNKDQEVALEELTFFTKRRVLDFVRAEYDGVRQMPVLKGEFAGLPVLASLDRARIRVADRPVPPSTPTPGEEKLKTFPNSIGMKLTLITAGTFQMGSPESDTEAEADEKPQHRVRITRPFYLGVHEVTRGQFRRFVDEAGYQTEAEKDGKGGWGWNEETKKFEQNTPYTWQNPGFEQTDDHPVVNVSWNDATAFAEWLSRKEGKTYRLPTEAEWEYACRAGTTSRYSCGDDPEGLAAVGNIADGTAKQKYPNLTTISARDGYVYTAPVGRFQPNAFGLYDMHGNVWEWCSDGYADGYAADYYKQSPGDDPPGVAGASGRVLRGGCWHREPRLARSAYRGWSEPGIRHDNLGFRLALVQSGR